MDKIILDIQKAMELLDVTEQWVADKTGIPQSTVHRIVAGKNKRLDLSKIGLIQGALGIVADPSEQYQAEIAEKKFVVTRLIEGAPQRPRVAMARELINDMSDEELDELIAKLLNRKISKGGDSQPE